MGFSAIFQCTYGVQWSNLVSSFPLPPQLPAITILPDFGNLIASSVHSDTPVQHVCDVKSEVLTPDFQRCIVIHRLLTPQQANLYLLPDWLRASLMLATPIPPFLASCPFPSFPPQEESMGKHSQARKPMIRTSQAIALNQRWSSRAAVNTISLVCEW